MRLQRLPACLRCAWTTALPADSTVPLPSGQYGYLNDGAWHNVSIPIGVLVAAAPKADLSKVTSPFVIADRYAYTGKASGSNITSRIDIDGIHWAR